MPESLTDIYSIDELRGAESLSKPSESPEGTPGTPPTETASKGVSSSLREAPEKVECPECGSKFKNQTGLRRHATMTHGTSAPRSKPAGAKLKDLKDQLAERFAFVGALVAVRDETCGSAILSGSERLADSLANLARQDTRVRKALTRLIAGSAYGEVVIAAAAIAVPIMIHHNLLPSELGVLTGASRAGGADRGDQVAEEPAAIAG